MLMGKIGDDHHKCLGYFSVRFIEASKKWIMLYTCSSAQDPKDPRASYNANNGERGVYLRRADFPWGPWSAPQLILQPDRPNAYCSFMYNKADDYDDNYKGEGFNRVCNPRRVKKRLRLRNPREESVRDLRHLRDKDRYTERAWGGEYAPFLLPSRYAKSSSDGETTLYYSLSTWNPYQVVLMKTRLNLNQ
jgi:hypothetical protein